MSAPGRKTQPQRLPFPGKWRNPTTAQWAMWATGVISDPSVPVQEEVRVARWEPNRARQIRRCVSSDASAAVSAAPCARSFSRTRLGGIDRVELAPPMATAAMTPEACPSAIAVAM